MESHPRETGLTRGEPASAVKVLWTIAGHGFLRPVAARRYQAELSCVRALLEVVSAHDIATEESNWKTGLWWAIRSVPKGCGACAVATTTADRGKGCRAIGDAQTLLMDLAQWPSAGQRQSDPVWGRLGMPRNVPARAEQIGYDLLSVRARVDLLQSDDVGSGFRSCAAMTFSR